MKKSALLCLLIITALLLVGCSAAVNNGNNNVEQQNGVLGFTSANLENYFYNSEVAGFGSDFIQEDDEVTVIVELGDGIVSSYLDNNSKLTVAEYINSAEGQALIADMHAEQDVYLQKLMQSELDFEMHSVYTTLLSGFALNIRYGDIEIVEKICGKDNVAVSEVYNAPTAAVDYEALFSSEGIFASETAYNGEGMVIAVVDTAIDDRVNAFQTMPTNPMMNKDFIEEVMGALYITSDDFWYVQNEKTGEWEQMEPTYTFGVNDFYINEKVPFAFDYANGYSDVSGRGEGLNFARPARYDQNSYHGTHVAGIAVGNDGVIRSAAYEAQLVAMKVFGDGARGASAATIINALGDAIILGVDGINLSLGSIAGFTVDRTQIGYEKFMDLAAACGVTVCCATGNDNVSSYNANYQMTQLTSNPDNGVVASPASFNNLGIGSIDNNTYYHAFVGERRINLNGAVTSNSLSTDPLAFLEGAKDGEFEFVVVPGVGEAKDYEGLDLDGKIALVMRGVISFTQKAKNAEEAGAIATIVYNNADGIINPQLEEECIPVMTISKEDGQFLLANPESKIYFCRENRGFSVSIFSSKGALENLDLGVDLLGVGGNVLSSADMEIAGGRTDGYHVLSGTSMASPNTVSAMVALKGMLKQQFPGLTTRQLAILANKVAMSTAEIVRDADGNVVSPRSQGAGLMNLSYATTTQAYLDVTGENYTKLNLGSDVAKDGIYTLYFNVVNMSEKALSYDVSAIVLTELADINGKYMTGNSKALGFDYTVALNGKAVEGTTIQVEAGQQARIKMVITIDDAAKAYMDETYENGIYVDGFGVLESLDGGVDLSIPFIAFYGDWYQAPVFEPTFFDQDRDVQDLPVSIQLYDYSIPGTYFGGLTLRGQNGDINPANISIRYYNGIASIVIPLLRNASALKVDLYDKVTGDVFIYGDFQNIGKSYWYYGQQYMCVQLNLADAGLVFNQESWLNNGTFELKLTAQFNGQGNYEAVIPFRTDFEAPVLQSATYVEENGRTYIDLEVYDNIAASYIGVFTKDAKGNAIQIAKVAKPTSNDDYYTQIKSFKNGDVNSIRLDVTDYLPQTIDGKIMISIRDFAGNTAGYDLLNEGETSDPESVINNNKGISSFAYNLGEGTNSVDTLDYEIYNVNVNEKAAEKVRLLAASSSADFVINNGILEAYAGQGGDVVIPDGVTKIADYVFYQNHAITSVVLPEGLVEIGSFNFHYMNALESIKLPTTLTTLGTNDFCLINNCTEINIEDTNIWYFAGSFNQTGLDGDVVLPDAVRASGRQTEIMESFLGGMNIDSVTVKGQVRQMYLSFIFMEDVKSFTFENLVNKIDYQHVGSFLECPSLESIVFKDYLGEFGRYVNTVSGQNQSHAGFNLKSLKEIRFEGNVGTIKGTIFDSCYNLETVAFGGSIASLYANSFINCPKLTRFTVLEGNDKLVMDEETGVMYNAEKTVMHISPNWDFEGEFVVPETVKTLKDVQFCPAFVNVDSYSSFYMDQGDGTYRLGVEFLNKAMVTGDVWEWPTVNTKLTKVVLHSGITNIPKGCFAGCIALEEVEGTENAVYFREYCFYYSGLKSFKASETNKYFVSRTFKDAKWLETLEFHDNCVFYSGYNSNWALSGLESLKEITLPKGFYFNQIECFANCISLEKVINTSTKSTAFGQLAFYNTPALKELVGFEKVKSIGVGAFLDSGIVEVNLPGVTKISGSAFERATKLERYTFSDNLSSVGGYAFYQCYSLKEIKLGAKAKLSGDFSTTFGECTSVETIEIHEANPYYVLINDVVYSKDMTTLYLSATINPTETFVVPETVKTIAAGAFKNSRYIKTLDLGNITTIPDEMFMDSNVETVIGTPVVIGASAFKNTNLANIDLSQAQSINSYAFENTKLVEADISNLNGVGFGVFKNNAELKKIVIGENTGYFYLPFTFANCPNVEDIIVDENNKSFVIADETLYDADKTVVLKYFGREEVVEVREGVKKIFIGAYQGNEAIKEVILPSTLQFIGDAAFYGCTNLEKITFKSEKAPILESGYAETAQMTYCNFVDYIYEIDNTTIEIYTPDDASYATYIWKMYFANRHLLP